VNPFAARQEASQSEASQHKLGNLDDGGVHKLTLTWSEREALTATQAAKNDPLGSHIRPKEGVSASDLGSEPGLAIGESPFVPSLPPPAAPIPSQPAPAHESQPIPENSAFPVLPPRYPMQDLPEIPVEHLVKNVRNTFLDGGMLNFNISMPFTGSTT
jgi:hypothetical protein